MLCTSTLLKCPSVHSSLRSGFPHPGLGLHVLHQASVLLLHCASLCGSGRNWFEPQPRKLPSRTLFQWPFTATGAGNNSSYSVVNECLFAAQLGEFVFVLLVLGRDHHIIFSCCLNFQCWLMLIGIYWSIISKSLIFFALDIDENEARRNCEFDRIWSSVEQRPVASQRGHMSPSVWSAIQILASARWDAQKSQELGIKTIGVCLKMLGIFPMK